MMDQAEQDRYTAELAAIFDDMTPARRAWAAGQIREMLDELRADLLLLQALPDWQAMDPKAWRPSCPPPAEG